MEGAGGKSMDPQMMQQLALAMQQMSKPASAGGLVGATSATQGGPKPPIGYGKSLTDGAPSFAGLLQQLMRYPGTVS
jgi:hypothetical protein